MPRVHANGIEIDYEQTPPESGPDGRPVLVLLRGLGTQRIQWPRELMGALQARGLRLVCPDNRDVGSSEKLDPLGIPNLSSLMAEAAGGGTPSPPYALSEMALDVVGLLDALEIERAHVAGISMGGMIVQHLAARHGGRVSSMTSIMSSSGAPGLPAAKPEAMAALMTQPDEPASRESVIDNALATQRVIGSPGYPLDETAFRDLAGRVYDRCYHPAGVARQMAAVVCDANRHEMIEGIRVPSLVLHGEDDPLIPVEGGRDTAARIPGARFVSIAGMGHDVPPALGATLASHIADHVLAAEAS